MLIACETEFSTYDQINVTLAIAGLDLPLEPRIEIDIGLAND